MNKKYKFLFLDELGTDIQEKTFTGQDQAEAATKAHDYLKASRYAHVDYLGEVVDDDPEVRPF